MIIIDILQIRVRSTLKTHLLHSLEMTFFSNENMFPTACYEEIDGNDCWYIIPIMFLMTSFVGYSSCLSLNLVNH